jgi:glycerol uptake facilitator-like aquaporin
MKNTFKESMLILVYEFLGTFMMGILFYQYCQNTFVVFELKNDDSYKGDPKSSGNEIDKSPLLLGMFVIIMFGARISGSHYNPIITFSYMIGNVRQGKFDRLLGLFYIAAQFAGAMLAGLMNSFLRIGGDAELRATLTTEHMWESTLCEISGSFIIVFMYLCSTEDSTKFTKDSVMQTMVLAGSYLAAMTFAGSYVSHLYISPVNPAIALSMAIWNSSNK